jgi:hypothetical protein
MQEGIHAETPAQYQARLNSYIADKDPIEMLRSAPDVLAGLIAGLIEGAPDSLLNRRPAAGKWSVGAILAHLAEDELAGSWRYRQMIEHNGATLLGFDQDEWARLGNYESWSAAEALARHMAAHDVNHILQVRRYLERLEP